MRATAIAWLLLVGVAWGGPTCTVRHRGGHQMSPTWSFPTACIVHISAANVATAYVPASDTDASRGLQLIDATTAATDGTIYQGRNTCDIDTGVVLAHGVNYEGLGTGKSIITSDANVEIFYIYGTCRVRNLKVVSTGLALDCILVQGNGSGGATNQGNATLEYVETDSNSTSGFPGIWLNAGSPSNTTNNAIATVRSCTINGGAVLYNAATFEDSYLDNDVRAVGVFTFNNPVPSITATRCTIVHSGASNATAIVLTSGTQAVTGTFTGCTITLQAGTGNCVNIATAIGAKAFTFYNCAFTAPAAGFGVRASGSQATIRVWNGSITGPDGTTGKSLIQTAGTLSYNSAVQNGYAAVTGSPSLSTSGTVGTSN